MKNRILSLKMQKRILYYYQELYQNKLVKKTTEICDELGIDKSTLSKFLYDYCPSEGTRIGQIGGMILKCTKFGSGSQYIEVQKQYLKHCEYEEMVRQNIERINKGKK